MKDKWLNLHPDDLPEAMKTIAMYLMPIFEKPEHKHYLHLDIVLGTQRDKPNYIKFNIYTPTIGHNDTRDFHEFTKFLGRLRDESSVPVEVQKCRDAIEEANKRKDDADYQIRRAGQRLNELRIEFGDESVDNTTDLNLRNDL